MFSKLFLREQNYRDSKQLEKIRDVYKAAALSAPYGHPGAKSEDFANVAAPTRLPSRPGDTEPRQFVGRTFDTLNKTLTSYNTERDLLAKDIAKLNDEHLQLEASIDAIKVAIDKLGGIPSPVETAVAQALEAEFPANDGTK